MKITIEQLRSIFPHTDKGLLAIYLPLLNKYMPLYGITSIQAAAMFVAQIGHESGGFRYTEEIASGRAYDTGKLAANLGNTPEADGDGQKYKGRGLIQITGKTNYKLLSKSLFSDENVLLNSPEVLKAPTAATESACWFWQRNGLTQWAEKPADWKSNGLYIGIHMNSLQYVTYRINGGLNGYSDRLNYYNSALKVFSL